MIRIHLCSNVPQRRGPNGLTWRKCSACGGRIDGRAGFTLAALCRPCIHREEARLEAADRHADRVLRRKK